MPTFVTTGRFAQDGIRGLMAKPEDRSAAVSSLIEAHGGRLVSYYLTTGHNDFVLITEAPDAEAAVAAAMAAGASGSVANLHTAQAWTSAEFAEVAKKAAASAAQYRAPGT